MDRETQTESRAASEQVDCSRQSPGRPMQELPPGAGLAGRLFGGPAAAVAAQQEQAAAEVRCPRCDSANTKFCYYNNYNLAQPRHFCKACRRYWTRGGHLRNVPVGGGCRKPKPRRPAAAAAADGSGKNGAHGAHRDVKTPRSASAGASAGAGDSSSPAVDGDAPVSSTFSVVTEPGEPGSGNGSIADASAGPLAAGDTRTLLVPPPAPMFADQTAVFASLFAPPRPFPAFSSSAHHKSEEHVASLLADQQRSPPSTAAGGGTAPFSARSDDGVLAAGASDWPTGFELTGGIAGDASLPGTYWNQGSWTDPDPTVYLP